MNEAPFNRPSSPPPLSPLRPTAAKSIPSPLRCLTPTRSPVPAVQSPSHLRGTGPPPFNFDARERLLSVLTLGWVRALLLQPAVGYGDEAMYRLWVLCDGLVDSLLVRLARLKAHPPFDTFDTLVAELLAQQDGRRLPALQSATGRADEKAASSDIATAGWIARSPPSKLGTLSLSAAAAAVQTSVWDEEDDAIAAALGVQSPRLSRTATLPVLPYTSATRSRSPSASPTLSISPSMSPSFDYTTLSLPGSPTPSPPTRPMLPFLAAMSPSSCPLLTRSVSAQSAVVGAGGRPCSRQLQRSWTRNEMMECGSPDEELPARRLLQHSQVSMVREEEEN